MFNDPSIDWGVTSLEGWVEGYESTRFTKIYANEAIITSEYNHEYVHDWLVNNTPVKMINMY